MNDNDLLEELNRSGEREWVLLKKEFRAGPEQMSHFLSSVPFFSIKNILLLLPSKTKQRAKVFPDRYLT